MSTNATKPPSNARQRRAIHLGVDNAVKARKKLRKQRAEIHAAMTRADQLVEASKTPTPVGPKVKATDIKVVGRGWEVVTAGGQTTTGAWARVIPVGTSAQPAFDHSTDYGRYCFIKIFARLF